MHADSSSAQDDGADDGEVQPYPEDPEHALVKLDRLMVLMVELLQYLEKVRGGYLHGFAP